MWYVSVCAWEEESEEDTLMNNTRWGMIHFDANGADKMTLKV